MIIEHLTYALEKITRDILYLIVIEIERRGISCFRFYIEKREEGVGAFKCVCLGQLFEIHSAANEM